MKKNDLSALQENCFCFCDEEISREAPFQVPIDIPEGFTVDSAEAAAAVTWSTDHLSCISEPCLIQTGPETEDIGVRYAVRVQGTVTLLVSVSPVRNQYGQGNGSVSVIHTEEIDQVVYYAAQSDRCPDFTQMTVEDLLIVPPFYGSPLTVTGTIVFPPSPDPQSYVFTANSGDSTVSVIDAAANLVVATIPFTSVPTDLGVTLDKAYTYVLHGNTNLISVVDNQTLTVANTITVGTGPRKIQFDPAGELAYVMAAGSIYTIDLALQAVSDVFPVPDAADFALDPNGQCVFTANTIFWSIDQYDVNTGQLVDSLVNEFEYPSLIETPYAGDFAYVMTGELWPKGVAEISLSPLSREGDFNRLFETLRTIVFSFDSTRAYFLEPYIDPSLIHNLTVVNTATNAIIASVSVPGAFDLAVTPDNQYIYAAQPNDNTVTVYRTSDYAAVTVIPVGTGPSAIAM
ncbi:YncE family protein [Bacillus cabrialesii]